MNSYLDNFIPFRNLFCLQNWFRSERYRRKKSAFDEGGETVLPGPFSADPLSMDRDTMNQNQGKEPSGVTIPSNNNSEESGKPCDKLCIKQEVADEEEEEEGDL